jgi:hypothetical protein
MNNEQVLHKHKSVFEGKEYILCAAMMYNGMIISGYRHSDCHTLLEQLLGSNYVMPDKETYKKSQGFLTSKNRFVDRVEGYKIAKDCNQLWLKPVKGEDEILISENLYFYEEEGKMR